MSADITYQPLTQLARMIRKREVSATEVIEAHLRRIDAVNPALNAVVQICADEALAQARSADAAIGREHATGPLHGVPFTVKDNIPVAGVNMTNCTLGLKDNVPDEDATVVARLKAAGGIVLGKTNLPEIGMAGETDNLVYGRTNNPYNLDRTPGGSSGGEAAIIAAGGSPLGIGTDIGGSIRYPAHCCGIAGIKPAMGRIPWHAPFGYTDEMRQSGPMARNVDDLILALPLMSGPHWRDPSAVPAPLGDPGQVDIRVLKVAVHTDNGVATPDADTIATVTEAAGALRDAGVTIIEDRRPEQLTDSLDLYSRLIGASGGQQYRDALEQAGTRPDQISPMIRGFLEAVAGSAMSTAEFQRVILEWDWYRSELWGFFEQYDAILCPVNSLPAPPHGTGDENFRGLSYTAAYNLAGLPSVVVRGGTSSDGLPIGVQVVAGAWQEHVALALAKSLESSLLGWQPPEILPLRGAWRFASRRREPGS